SSTFARYSRDLLSEQPVRLAHHHEAESEEQRVQPVPQPGDVVEWVAVEDVEVQAEHPDIRKPAMVQHLLQAVLGPGVVVIEIPPARFRSDDRMGAVDAVHDQDPVLYKVGVAKPEELEDLERGEMGDFLLGN